MITYEFDDKSHYQEPLKEDEKQMLLGNIRQNATEIAEEYPDTTFIYFICPYSICELDSLESQGILNKYLQTEEIIIEECNKYENIEIYSFYDRADIIRNLSNYKDSMHYLKNVNAEMLACFKEKEGRITIDNFLDYKAREAEVIDSIR